MAFVHNVSMAHEWNWRLLAFSSALVVPSILLFKKIAKRKQLEKSIKQINELKRKDFDFGLRLAEEGYKIRFDLISSLSVSEIVNKLQTGELTAEEVLRYYIKIACYSHEKYNCLTETMFRESLQLARDLDAHFLSTGKPVGAFHGLPISIKDNIAVKGTDCSLGSIKLSNQPKQLDSVVVATLREKGAIIFCKTNVPETLLISETYNSVYGTTLNPFDKSRTCGGSSGGESTLIISGGSPMGLGTDIGGSVRIPSAFSGITGFKPTAGRISHNGSNTVVKGQEAIPSTIGPMALHVSDLSLLLKSLYDSNMWSKDPKLPPIAFDDREFESTRKLRIGYIESDPFFAAHYSNIRCVNKAKKLLEENGHTLIAFHPPLPSDRIYSLYLSFISADGMKQIRDYLKNELSSPAANRTSFFCSFPRFLKRAISFLLRLLNQPRLALQINHLGPFSPLSMAEMIDERRKFANEYINEMKELNLDAVISPTNGSIPYLHGYAQRLTVACNYTLVQNLFNFPAGVVPITTVKQSDNDDHQRAVNDIIDRIAVKSEKDGLYLPVAVQVFSLPWKDETVLRIMKEIEEKASFQKSDRMKKFVVNAAFGEVGTLLHTTTSVNIDDEPLF